MKKKMWYEIPIFVFSSHWNLFAVGSELTHFLSRVSVKLSSFVIEILWMKRKKLKNLKKNEKLKEWINILEVD